MATVDQSLRVGVVGAGKIAETHIPYIRRAGGEMVGLADLSMVQANDLADRFSVQRIYSSVAELLDTEKPDVLHVLTPPHTHARVAVEALNRGVHCLVEKPLSLESGEAQEMAEAARKSGALLCVDHNRLFDPVMIEARELASSGALGEIVAIESYQAGQASPRDWLDTLPGGSIGDLIPHPLYLQLAFLGEVKDLHVFAFRSRVRQEDGEGAIDELRVLMEGDKTSGVLTISANARPQLNTLKLYGTEMTVEVNLNNMTLVRRRDYNVPKVIGKSLPNLDEAATLVRQTGRNAVDFLRGKVRYYPGMGTLIGEFYQAVRTGGPSPVSLEAGLDVVRVTERIWQALGRATGTTVGSSGASPRAEV